jgi:hypothetical protein
MEVTDPLELPLRDIHLPGEIPFWPLAPGWWILAGLLVLLVVGVWLLHRYRQQMKLSAINLARVELQRIISAYEQDADGLTLLRQISILLRRVSISLFPRTEVAALTGDAWLQFLDRPLSGRPFSGGKGRLLSEAPYRSSLLEEDIESLLKHCREWIDSVSVTAGAGK